jgi:hypothetical protein
MGDGYCGFWFPFSSTSLTDEVLTVLEIREKRFDVVLGRIILGRDDKAKTRRLDAAESALASADRIIDGACVNSSLVHSMNDLGQTLLYLSGRARDKRRLGVPGLQACLEQIGEIPALDLGWEAVPRFSLIIRADGDIAELAGRIRALARALEKFGAEFILLDDGTSPLAALLPTRLRHLGLVPIVRSDRPGIALNAAAAAARGAFLAYARRGGPRPAHLRGALERASKGKLDIDANIAPALKAEVADLARHGLTCIVSREDFAALGGFEPLRPENEMWTNFLAKAKALDLKIAPWAAPQPGRLHVG